MNRVLCGLGWWLVLHCCGCEPACVESRPRPPLVEVPEQVRGRMLRRIRRRLRQEGLL